MFTGYIVGALIFSLIAPTTAQVWTWRVGLSLRALLVGVAIIYLIASLAVGIAAGSMCQTQRTDHASMAHR